MASKKNEEEEDFLLLGSNEVETEEKQSRERGKSLPVFMMIMGILLMTVGYFYNDISKFLGISYSKEKITKTREEIQKEKKQLLECSKEEEDKSLEITRITSYTFYFADKKLTTSEERRVVKAVKDSDVGSDNVKVIGTNYDAGIQKFESVPGMEVYSTLSKEKYVLNIDIDYKNLDLKKVPADDNIKIVHKLDDDYRTVHKKMITELHAVCD